MSETSIGSKKVQPKIKLDNQDWLNFKTHLNTTYPRASFTHEQKEFVKKALLQENGQCSDLNRYWVSFFVQNLIEHVDETWQGDDIKSLNEQIDKLKPICAKAILGFFESQHILRLEIPYTERNAFHERMLEIHPNIVNFPIELCVDMGRILNLQKYRTVGVKSADITIDNALLFQQVHNKLQQLSEPGKEKLERQVSGQSSTTEGTEHSEAEWTPHGSDDTYMRLCVYKLWADKYEMEEEWSPNKMVNEWLKEAIQLYNNVSYHWPNCKVKHFSDKQFPAIQSTAIHSWLRDVSDRAGTTSIKVRKPSTHWISDWHAAPVFEKRHEWEQYYCTVILNAKNIAKLLHKEEKLHDKPVPMEEVNDVTEGPETKRPRTEGSNDLASETPLDIITRELQKVEKLIIAVERNARERHQESLRELAGHFDPVRVHLLHLNQGQNHLQSSVDRLHK